MDRLRALPGVTGVGVVNNIPLDEGTGTVRVRTEEMSGDAQRALLNMNFTGGDYFRVMGIPTAAGPHVHQRRSGHAEQQRDHQSVGGREALAQPESARAAASVLASAIRTRSRSRSSASWGT